MTATNGALVAQVRQAIEAAAHAGQPRPGRPTLVRLTGATDYAVRKALAHLANEADAAGEPPPPVSPADSATRHCDSPAQPQEVQRPAPTQTEPDRLPRPWPLVIIGLAAAVAIWGGWVRLGELTGFGPINLLPGIGGGLTVNTAVVLPLSVEFYSAYALRVLLASDQLAERTKRFAGWTFAASLIVGGSAQIASHIMVANHVTTAPWPVTTVVSCVPLLVLGLASGLAALVKQDAAHRPTRPDNPPHPRS